ncbi:MAG: hypothetical protein QMD14_03410 [Candidatus Aenigmarchaeota archaeon]|nr:hypothetical protein [Candidatus Aenigmarchaeota archaeon]
MKIFVLIVLISLALGVILGNLIVPKVEVRKIETLPSISPVNVTLTYEVPSLITLKVPAIDNQGKGVMTTLKVQARPGEGSVLVDIRQLLFWVDTQHSIRIAKGVAEAFTGINTSSLDLIYSIETNASIIGGESAGAAITIATIAAIQNKTLREDVTITGTVQEDGSIGAVGAVLEKGKASKEAKAKLFLVPVGQGKYKEYQPVIECKEYRIGGFYQKICTSEYKVVEVDIGKNVGIEVKEVKNIEEALKYFID